MTTKRIVFRRSDGVVEIINPALNRVAELMAGGKTEDEAIAIIQANAFSKLPDRGFGLPEDFEVMEASAIPQSQPGDREFRDALEKPGIGPPVVNMTKARSIHARKISAAWAKAVTVLQRRVDEATLEDRTADITKAANDKAAVGGLDLTTISTQIAGAANPTALSAIWPTELQEFKP